MTLTIDKPIPYRLTCRQREVLALMATGQTLTQISASLGIKRDSVYKHILGAMCRMGAVTRDQMMVWVGHWGLDNDESTIAQYPKLA